jgi:chondroitin synthase
MPDNDYSHIEAEVHNHRAVPSVSATVVIPFYEGLGILDRTLASLTLQTYPRDLWEIVVVEDGSPQSTEPIVGKYARDLNILRVGQERQGFRLSAARNLGIRLASGDVIVLLDFDVVCLPDHLAYCLRWFKMNSPVATFGLREFVDLTGFMPSQIASWIVRLPSLRRVPSTSNRFRTIDKRVPEVDCIKFDPFPCNSFHGCNIAFWREDALRVGLFDTAFDGYPGYEDIEFAYRLQQLGRYIVYEPRATVYHQENQVVSLEQRQQGRIVNLKKLYRKVPGIGEYRSSIAQEQGLHLPG